MAELQAHRGPDDQGMWIKDNVGLVFRRLAIIDLSAAGHQPMCNETGDVWIVYNGEIYNYVELRQELQARGHCFRSHADTEVIVHGYEEYGDDCVTRLNGMFAFAIWDERRRRLFLARDRVGVKPLHYHYEAGKLVFASEIKAVLAGANLVPRPNAGPIFDYLTSPRINHTDETFFAGVRQLAPAHVAVYEQGRLRLRRYWDVQCAAEDRAPLSTQTLDAYAERFAALLTDSIRLRLRSDVPVGTCLSGGLDSSAIVCIANQLLREGATGSSGTWDATRQKTFSARYRDFVSDEGPFIAAVMEATGVDAHEVYPDGARLAEELQPLLWFQEEPFGSTSIYAQWNVMRLARSCGVTVLLDGQGSDEQLAGYYRYFGPAFADLLHQRALRALVHEVAVYSRKGYPLKPLMLGLAVALLTDRWTVRAAWNRIGSRFAPAWLNPAFRNAHDFYPLPRPRFPATLNETLYRAVTSESLPGLLRYEDRNSMAFSIEARVPFLDYRLIEFVFGLPPSARIHDGTTKVVLRRALSGIIPEAIRVRQDKIGFATPQEQWLRGPLRPVAEEVFASSSFAQRGYVQAECVRRMWRRLLAGEQRYSRAVWRCLNLELWLRYTIDTPGWCRRHPFARGGD
jgi:asparagine synthase (glutamine-hydrolysing)